MKINRQTNYKTFVLFFLITLLFFNNNTYAGHQKYSELKEETALLLSQSVSDTQPSFSNFKNQEDEELWVNRHKRKIEKNFIDEEAVIFLKTLHYEATRAGLDPKLILSLVQVESNFTKYAISSVGARGYMQVMPFWVEIIGKEEHNLFHLRTNLRYGCTILRHYLELEKGNLFMALGRYNGTR